MNDKQIKLAVCLPTGEMVHAVFAMSLAHMVCQTFFPIAAGHVRLLMQIVNGRGPGRPCCRSQMIEQAIEWGAPYALFLDSDMRFPAHTATRLVAIAEETGAGIVACNYSTRTEGHVLRTQAFRQCAGVMEPAFDTDGISEVDAAPFGIMLMRTEMFAHLLHPWFEAHWRADGSGWEAADFVFCRRVRELGHKILVDFGLSQSIAHIGSFSYTLNEASDLNAVGSQTGAKRTGVRGVARGFE